MLYVISYDLHEPTNNRDAVEEAIKSLGEFCKCVSTTYLVSTYMDITSVRNVCAAPLDKNDRMIICVTEKPIYGRLLQTQWDHIRDNL